MWDLPGPGLEPVLPALAGGFLTTMPPGKSTFLAIMYVYFTGLRYVVLRIFTEIKEILYN